MQAHAKTRRLILMRHGEAASPTTMGGDGDFPRPLTAKGVADTRHMASWLADQAWRPDGILCSSARRTRETAQLVREGLSLPESVECSDDRLYLAGESTFLAVLAEQPADWDTLMLVGHNPGLAGLIARMSGQYPPVPPATMALLQAHTPDWQLSGQPLQTHAIRQPGPA